MLKLPTVPKHLHSHLHDAQVWQRKDLKLLERVVGIVEDNKWPVLPK